MSKKKNTLKDLDEFLKQQAATLVQPASLSGQLEEKAPESVQKTVEPKVLEKEKQKEETVAEIDTDQLLKDLKVFGVQEGPAFRKKFYDIIIKSIESQSQSLPEDKMLINTALYLKSGDSWKETIRNYWKNK